MLGQINEWFFHDLAGIQPDPAAPGFEKIIIKPAIVGDLAWVSATFESVRGPIKSRWTKTADTLTLDVFIPPGSTATVCVPAAQLEAVTESGRPAATAPGVTRAALDGAAVVCEIGSGNYHFEARLK